ncbi:MAG: hypothetical protein NVSMB57_03320 [Actinomycetota bacterium]
MNEPLRCPSCGAANAAAAAWCGQCLVRFDGVPAQTKAEVPSSVSEASSSSSPNLSSVPSVPHGIEAGGIRREGDALLWLCPACATENSIEHITCMVCGTSMATLFGATKTEELKRIGPAAVGWSAALPGAGHVWAGRIADGLARIVLFVWTAGVGLLLITRSSVRSGVVFHSVGAVFLLAAVAVWVIAFLEAQRLARGRIVTLIPGKVLLWGTAALTLVLFVGLAIGARTR